MPTPEEVTSYGVFLALVLPDPATGYEGRADLQAFSNYFSEVLHHCREELPAWKGQAW